MSKLAIICNDLHHAEIFVMKPLGLNRADCVVITPERTTLMYGYKDIDYIQLRPLYAREKSYIESHGWNIITMPPVEAKDGE